ncbi:MAG: SOS response-associated peptidase, partial [Gemmatimonadales bacterium]
MEKYRNEGRRVPGAARAGDPAEEQGDRENRPFPLSPGPGLSEVGFMCGRYTLTQEQEALQAALGVAGLLHPRPRYNVAPTQEAPVILASPSGLQCEVMRWGLIPSWAEDPAMGSRMINARSETAHRKPSFREPFRHRRCLVPADGFYEWSEEGGRKVPFLIRLASGNPFTFAGLWERWESPERGEVRTFTILTRDAIPAIHAIHPRMPVLIPSGERERWLDPETPVPDLQDLLLRPRGEGDELSPGD